MGFTPHTVQQPLNTQHLARRSPPPCSSLRCIFFMALYQERRNGQQGVWAGSLRGCYHASAHANNRLEYRPGQAQGRQEEMKGGCVVLPLISLTWEGVGRVAKEEVEVVEVEVETCAESESLVVVLPDETPTGGSRSEGKIEKLSRGTKRELRSNAVMLDVPRACREEEKHHAGN
ncbi:hypothetical protein O3P69_017111 [Scylla paramamosain]|uniref:Uncharacterized protein n=1 Tax=Scylla paramamosain TaxID=85552 RepID=A0AAW0TUK5_SCYPA